MTKKKKESAREMAAASIAAKRKEREVQFLYQQIQEYRRLIEECHCKIDKLENVSNIEERLISSEEIIGRKISAREVIQVFDKPELPNHMIKERLNKYKKETKSLPVLVKKTKTTPISKPKTPENSSDSESDSNESSESESESSNVSSGSSEEEVVKKVQSRFRAREHQ